MGAGGIPLKIEKEFFDKARGNYSLSVYTAGAFYRGDDRVNVSLYGGLAILLPPKQLLLDYKFGNITEKEFKRAYLECLEESYIHHRYFWEIMVSKRKLVLVCSCGGKGRHCHRYFIIEFLKKLGATYKGEVHQTRRARK